MNEEKKKQVIALGQLGWSLRQIEKATGIRRETASGYLKAAGIGLRPPGGWGKKAPVDLISVLISDELTTRADRLLERRRKLAGFRDPHRSLDNFDFAFNPKMNRNLIFDLATGGFIAKQEDALFLGPGGTGKSHLAQAIGQAAIMQGYRVPRQRSVLCSTGCCIAAIC